MSLASCTDFLNVQPTKQFSYSTVWDNETALNQYVIGFYSLMRESADIAGDKNRMKTEFTDAYSDLIKSNSWDQYDHRYNVSLCQESAFGSDDAGAFACWSNLYQRIRRYNEFLRDAPKYVEKYGQDKIDSYSAEVRFLRAFSYFRLIRVYGPVVLRKEVDGPEQNDKPRATIDQSWDMVIEDFKFAGEKLPVTNESGRATKAAAYALMSRATLYAERWDDAVWAADKCKEFGGTLSLEENGGYEGVFSNAANPENLFVVYFKPGYIDKNLSHWADTYFRPSGDQATHNNVQVNSAFSPTNELVDSYEMADGTPFSWETHGDNPYEGREPRFYATILYNGAKWEGRKIETFEGGADGILPFEAGGAAKSTVTGYYLKKWITEDDATWEKNGSSHFAIITRYAEVLLNKAEALAMADWSKNKTDALAALNEVRARVSLKPVDASSLDEFMKHIRHERVVELAGEGFRYWDIRRWKLGEEIIAGKPAHGVKWTKNGEDLSYEIIEVDAGRTRIFYPRFYAFSLPMSEISNNAGIGVSNNNPGW